MERTRVELEPVAGTLDPVLAWQTMLWGGEVFFALPRGEYRVRLLKEDQVIAETTAVVRIGGRTRVEWPEP